MKTSSNFGCPNPGHSILCWNAAQNLWADPIRPTDPSACGTSLKKGGNAAKPLFTPLFKGGRGDLFSTFLTDTDPAPLPKLNPSPDLSRPLRRPLRVLLVGERQDVLTTIQNLHKRGFADAGDWSIPLPYPQQNPVSQFIPRGSHIVISVHTKYMS